MPEVFLLGHADRLQLGEEHLIDENVLQVRRQGLELRPRRRLVEVSQTDAVQKFRQLANIVVGDKARSGRIDIGSDHRVIVCAVGDAEHHDDVGPGRGQKLVALLGDGAGRAEKVRVVGPDRALSDVAVSDRPEAGVADRRNAFLVARILGRVARRGKERTDVAPCLHDEEAWSGDLQPGTSENSWTDRRGGNSRSAGIAVDDVATRDDGADIGCIDVLNNEIEIDDVAAGVDLRRPIDLDPHDVGRRRGGRNIVLRCD